MNQRRAAWYLTVSFAIASAPALATGCGDDGGGSKDDIDAGPTISLDDFLPDLPAPTGEPQSVWAGSITPANAEELIVGPATSGMMGDFFLRNAKGRYVVQAPTRVLGVVPQGGNLVDAVPLTADGKDASPDQFGELSLIYLLGRTCEHTEADIVQDGSGGGAAVLRMRGVTAVNDYINLRAIGILPPIDEALIPDTDDQMRCATTYVLEPDSDRLQVLWTLFNPGNQAIRGPFGAFSDTGGEVRVWSPGRGFESIGLEGALSGAEAAVDYLVFQGPGVAYGIVPRHQDAATPNAASLVSGVSILLFGSSKIADIFEVDKGLLEVGATNGVTLRVEVVLGRDAADVEEAYRVGYGDALAEVSGVARWDNDEPATEARVGLYEDVDGNGEVDPDDVIRAYMDADSEGSFSARIPPGNYLLRAQVEDLAQSPTTAVSVSADGVRDLTMKLPPPVTIDYSVSDDFGSPTPARITILGTHPAPPDPRLFANFDRRFGTVRVVHALRGMTKSVPEPDPRLRLPALPEGGAYRFLVSRGTEWSMASELITASELVEDAWLFFDLQHVASAEGYIASEYHVHQVGSPDSIVSNEQRVASMVAEGIEFFAATDHDFVTNLQPVIEALELDSLVRSVPGVEITPFAYGHFNAYPMAPDDTSPNFGAIDWARSEDGDAMTPGEIFAEALKRGAQVVQVNHPRSANPNGGSFQEYFDRAGLVFDYDGRQISNQLGPVPNDWLRLPEGPLWDDGFNALEVWNGFGVADTNDDKIREITSLDLVMRDWFNFLSFGFVVTPIGNSDSHTAFVNPAGFPRTYVGVADDSAEAIVQGSVALEVLTALRGEMVPRDIVVTNGPHIKVSVPEAEGSVLGKTLTGVNESVTFNLSVLAPDWAEFDTVEVFVNATPEIPTPSAQLDVSALTPALCYTTRAEADMEANDVCLQAVGGPQPLTVELANAELGGQRLEATLSVTVAKADIVNRAGAAGEDAWVVFRVRGNRAIYPLLLNGVISEDTLDTLVQGEPDAVDAILRTSGVPAAAFTAPVFIDFDGGGYRAVFGPE